MVRVDNYCTEIELYCEDVDYELETAKRDWQDLDTNYRDFIHKGHTVYESNCLRYLLKCRFPGPNSALLNQNLYGLMAEIKPFKIDVKYLT